MQAKLDTVTTTSYNINADEIMAILAKYEGVTLTQQHIIAITDEITHISDDDNIKYALEQSTYSDLLDHVAYGDHYNHYDPHDGEKETQGRQWDYPTQNFSSYLAYVLDNCPSGADDQICKTLGVNRRTFRNWIQLPSPDFSEKNIEEPDLSVAGGLCKLQLPPEPVKPTLVNIIKICITLHLASDVGLRLLQLSGSVDLIGASDRKSRLAILLVCRCTAMSWDQCHQLLLATGFGQILGIN